MDLDPAKFVPAKHAFSLFDEFKKFAFKGNMIDLAIALVVGGAFSRLVESFVKSIVMPAIASVMPGPGVYLNWKIPHTEILIGQFLGEFVNFLIVTFVVFLFMVKLLGFLFRQKEVSVPPAPPTKTEELLAEIRDLLSKQK